MGVPVARSHTRTGSAQAPPAGEGRDIPVPDFVWHIIQALPDRPLCPGATRRTRYLSYVTATSRMAAIAAEVSS